MLKKSVAENGRQDIFEDILGVTKSILCRESQKHLECFKGMFKFLYHSKFVVQVNSREYDEDFVLTSLKKSLNVWTSDLMTVLLVDVLNFT